MISTPTLRFWGFKEHPFADNILRSDLLDLFVDRGQELAQVEDYLGRSRVVGVHGNLGVGKSSFLHKLRAGLLKEKTPVAYVHLNADSESTLYRELLTELLLLIGGGSLRIKQIPGFKIAEEAQRLHASVESSRGADYGAKIVGLMGKLIEGRKVSLPMHTETSARESIRKVFDALKCPLVVIFDDFEKLRYESSGTTRDYFPILSRFISTLEELLNRKDVAFVVSMDDQVEQHIENQRKKGGQFAFSLNSLCRIPNLSLDHLWELIATRLKRYGWKGSPAAFMDDEAFFALAVASSNHPRKAVTILAEAMRVAATRKNAKPQINADAIIQGASDARLPVDEKDWMTVRYLLEHSESSNDDDALRQYLGYNRAKKDGGFHTSVHRRLMAIASAFQLDFDETTSGQTTRKLLKLPKVNRQ